MSRNTIGIVGCGFSGAATLIALIEAMKCEGRTGDIYVFESSGVFGPGLAYDVRQPPWMLLNHEADDMGEFADGSTFLSWLKENRTRFGESPDYQKAMARGYFPMDEDGCIAAETKAYYPRALFGLFVQETLEKAVKESERRGVHVHLLPAEVTRMHDHEDGTTSITYRENDKTEPAEIMVEAVALTSGHWFFAKGSGFQKTERYLSRVYMPELIDEESAFFDAVERRPRVLLVKGTGLSANDAAILALESGKVDKVVMCGGRGQLRAVRGEYDKDYTLRYLTSEAVESLTRDGLSLRLEDVVSLLRQEFEHAYGHPLPWDDILNYNPENTQTWLREQIEASKVGPLSWRTVFVALKSVRELIYRNLSPEDKERFANEMASLFFTYQAPMSRGSAEKLLQWMEEGKLEVVGGAQSIAWSEEKQRFEITIATDADGRPISYRGRQPTDPLPQGAITRVIEGDFLVDAIGHAKDIRWAGPLFERLIEEWQVAPNPVGGIHIDPVTHHVMTAEHRPHDHWWATGAMASGDILISANVLPIACDGKMIAAAMIEHLVEREQLALEHEAEAGITNIFGALHDVNLQQLT